MKSRLAKILWFVTLAMAAVLAFFAVKAMKPAPVKKIENVDSLVILESSKKVALIKDEEVIQRFIEDFTKHDFSDPGVALQCSGYVFLRTGREVAHIIHCYRDADRVNKPIRDEFYSVIDGLLAKHSPTKEVLFELSEYGPSIVQDQIESIVQCPESNLSATVVQRYSQAIELDKADKAAAATTASILKSADDNGRKAIFKSLVTACESAESSEIRRGIMGLSNFGKEAAPIIERAMANPDLKLQAAGFFALSKIGVEASTATVERALKLEDNVQLRYFLLESLQQSKNKLLVPLLIKHIFRGGYEKRDYFRAAKVLAHVTEIDSYVENFHFGLEFDSKSQGKAIAEWESWFRARS